MAKDLTILVQWQDDLITLAPVPLIFVANFYQKHRLARAIVYIVLWVTSIFIVINALSGLVAYVALKLGPQSYKLIGNQRVTAALKNVQNIATHPQGYIIMLAGGLIAMAVTLPDVRKMLARFIPIDPNSTLHACAISLAVLVISYEIGTQLIINVLAIEASSPGITKTDLILSEIPFLIIAFVGVGIFIRRSPKEALSRLGLTMPSWKGILAAVILTVLLLIISFGFDVALHHISPSTSQTLQKAEEKFFGHLQNLSGAVTAGLVAGICEETLFRGALQPRLGIVFTSVLFAALHTEYGLSVDTLNIFILSVSLGLLRKYFNTSSSILTHVLYDFSAFFIP